MLVFSQFTLMLALALIEAELTERALPYVLLTGDTLDRKTPLRRLQAADVPIFLISLKAGGVGLNLTAADTVIHYDPWWNPAVEAQATDRAHQTVQTKTVFVHRLIAIGTIEEKMEVLKVRKQAWAAGILDADAGSTLNLTEEDVAALFEPAVSSSSFEKASQEHPADKNPATEDDRLGDAQVINQKQLLDCFEARGLVQDYLTGLCENIAFF